MKLGFDARDRCRGQELAVGIKDEQIAPRPRASLYRAAAALQSKAWRPAAQSGDGEACRAALKSDAVSVAWIAKAGLGLRRSPAYAFCSRAPGCTPARCGRMRMRATMIATRMPEAT